jgi:class 3 adenylate cyclase/tetratricopeptide (TPR) repeat protein
MVTCGVCGSAAPDGAHFCATCGAALDDAHKGSERKLATLIFADLVGSTEFAGTRDPERTRILLERFYDSMADEIRVAGGTIEKFAGDAVMAAFGAPASLEDHAERALHTAIAMQRRIQELVGDAPALRIGVNTGEVVAGKAREGSSFVSGDAVNVAARLEQAAGPGEILVGERTVALVRGAFEFGEPRIIEAKGKPGGVGCRRLLRALSLMRTRGVLGLRRAFVGRDVELATLERIYDEVVERREPRLVTILGDAGVGKTRLVREFWERLGSRSPEPLRRTGRCLSYGEGVTYWPLGEVLKEHFGISESDPPAAILSALPTEILGLTLGLDVGHGLHPLAARDRFQDAWVGFCDTVSAERTLVMLIEDIHWGEELLLDLVERLAVHTRGPLLLVATARPELLESRPGWGARVPGTMVVLEALSVEDSVRLLDQLLGGSLPAGLRDVVVERAEGNPFFVEEVLGTLIDLGLLHHENGRWTLAELPPDFSVPDTVQAVVAARVDLLGAADKEGLQAASVIGRIFWAGPVYDLVAEGEPDLRVIEERDFIRRRSSSSIPGDREYAIKHALTREVAYAGLPKARRAHMHAGFARWLERNGLGRDEFASLLAHHYAEAVRPEDVDLAWEGRQPELDELRERAITWLRQAGDLAIGRMEIDDAVSLLDRAIAVESDPQRQAELWHAVGRASILKYDGERFWTAMQAALENTTDRATSADIYADLAMHTAIRAGMWMSRPDPALVAGWIDRALELAEPGTPARAKALFARVYEDPNNGEAAEEALAIAEALDDIELRSFAYDSIATVSFARGDYGTAYEWVERRIELVPRLTDPDHISLVYNYSLAAVECAGHMDEARQIATMYDEVTRRLSPHHRLHAAYVLVEVESMAGRWEAVRDLMDRAESAVAANANTPCALEDRALLLCALAQVLLGADTEAKRLEAVAAGFDRQGFGYFTRPIEAQIALARGDLSELARMLQDWKPEGFIDVDGLVARLDGLVALDRRAEIETEAPALVIEGSYLEPFALRALGWARGDGDMVRQAVACFEAMEMAWHAQQTSSLIGDG